MQQQYTQMPPPPQVSEGYPYGSPPQQGGAPHFSMGDYIGNPNTMTHCFEEGAYNYLGEYQPGGYPQVQAPPDGFQLMNGNQGGPYPHGDGGGFDLNDIAITPLDAAIPVSNGGSYQDGNSLMPPMNNGGGYSMNYNGGQCYAGNIYHSSPAGSSHASTGSDESEEVYGYPAPYKRTSPVETEVKTKRARQGKKRKPRRDPNEPQKPVSAYALFFRDTQAAIKGQNPNASFGEVSKIVASMWDSLDVDAKNVYKQRTEAAKKDYLKQLAAYRANQVSRGGSMTGLEGFAEFSQSQRKLLAAAQVASPDSTTPGGGGGPGGPGGPGGALGEKGVGEKSLASLIAEPSPHHILTATTTLTVPQSCIIPNRPPKVSSGGGGGGSNEGDLNQGSPMSCKGGNGRSPQGTPQGHMEEIHPHSPWPQMIPSMHPDFGAQGPPDCALLPHCRYQYSGDAYSGWIPTPQPSTGASSFASV